MILNDADERRIGQALQGLTDALTLRVHSNQPDSTLTKATLDLVDYTVSLAPQKLNREAVPLGADMLDPTTLIVSSHGAFGVRFIGTPSGTEYTTFIQALMTYGNPLPHQQPPWAEWLQQIAHPVTADIFVSTTCTRCPQVVDQGIHFARIQPMIAVNIIQAEQFPDISQTHQVMGVPTIWCRPGPYKLTGMTAPEYFAAYLIQASTQPGPDQ
ncbi:MAG: thioredoxin family protein [Sulfobacillus thermotolerans]|nr:thioredoxin family protein [Sulfobacillus thermotolerans]